jgi:hypothetical protein
MKIIGLEFQRLWKRWFEGEPPIAYKTETTDLAQAVFDEDHKIYVNSETADWLTGYPAEVASEFAGVITYIPTYVPKWKGLTGTAASRPQNYFLLYKTRFLIINPSQVRYYCDVGPREVLV